MTHPRLTIGLPVYNGEDYLAESLDALLGQTYADFELLISSNGSTDATDDICRDYQARDSRIRFVRQPRNLGCAANDNFLLDHTRTELFKWAAADDLYARDLLERCVGLLDEQPDAIMAHSWTAAVDGEGTVTQAMPYPLATDSPIASERFRSVLFGGDDAPGSIRADDWYGVMRTDVLRRVRPNASYYRADQVFSAELALHGRFVQVPDWLYFRRHHAGRAQVANPSVRSWCTNLDPRRADRLRHPTARLVAEYPLGYLSAIRRAPLEPAERRACYAHLARWAATRVTRRLAAPDAADIPVPPPGVTVRTVVAGQ